MKRRALRLLDAAGAPAHWLRHAGRAARRLGAVDRGAGWIGPLAGPPPPLRPGPPWGAALAQLAVLPPRAAPGEPAAAAAPRRLPAPQAPPLASRARGEHRERSASRRSRVPSSPRRASAARATGDGARAPDPATLARRAGEPLLRRLAGPVPPPYFRFDRSAGGIVSPRDAAERRAWMPSAADSGRAAPIPPPSREPAREALLLLPLLARERRAWTPSPDALPILAVRDRTQGVLAGRAAARAGRGAGEGTAGAERAWSDWLAAAAGRRLPRGASIVPRGGRGERGASSAERTLAEGPHPASAPGGWDPARSGGGAASAGVDGRLAPGTPSAWEVVEDGSSPGGFGATASERAAGPRLAAEWASPLDGPAAPAAVLARLAGRTRGAARPRPAERPDRGTGAQAASPSPRSRSVSGTAAEVERAGDGADASLSPLLRRPRLAASGPTADGGSRHGADASLPPFLRRPRLASSASAAAGVSGPGADASLAPLLDRPRLAPSAPAADGESGHGADASLAPLFGRPRLAPSAPAVAGESGHGADASLGPFPRPPHPRGGEPAHSASSAVHAAGTDATGSAVRPGLPDAAESARRDRWRGWPAVLAWPQRGARTGGSGGAPAADRTAPAAPGAPVRDTSPPAVDAVDAVDAREPARAPRPGWPAASGPARGAVSSPSAFARAAVRRPAPALEGGTVGETSAPAGWLIDAVRALTPAPGAPAGIGGAVSPAPGAPADAAAAGEAPEEAGLPALGTGAVPLPWFLGGAGDGEGDPGGELDVLAGRIRRILDDEVRRHGIDV